MLTRELIGRLPKAELHTHLDSALRPDTMVELARAAKFELPTTDPDALRRFMLVDDAGNLEDYLARFEYTIPLLQTPEGIERVSYEMVEDAARDGLRYLEVRYCPKLSTRGGLTMEQALDAELLGLARGERDFGVVTRVINCSLRHYSPEVSVAIARLPSRIVTAASWRSTWRAARRAGSAASQGCFRPGAAGISRHHGARGRSRRAGIGGGGNLALSCQPDRPRHPDRRQPDTHGVHPGPSDSGGDQYHQQHSDSRRAPASAHPVREYFDAGLNVTLCTDGWLMTGVSLTDEYWLAHTELGFTREEIDQLILNGFESAFLAWPERQKLLARVKEELAGL